MNILEKFLLLFKKKKNEQQIKKTAQTRVPRTNAQSTAKTENLSHKRMPSSKEVDTIVQKAKHTPPKTALKEQQLRTPKITDEATDDKKKPKRYYKYKNKKKFNKQSAPQNTSAQSKPL